ncbi:bzip transcription factor [Stylonychia lemnae]|uniref:Bzip transcription factor n=1 Tax=Stylonychia lemnae TaxID=5949 RepID=A0A078A2M5_STYLE|nr:bzip transcription factor [Stylonychia lemnae]|eukprot:CDW76471.1 bzip transcription factor [Stylonychia lemnae]
MNPTFNSYTSHSKSSSGTDLTGVQSVTTCINAETLSKEISRVVSSLEVEGIIYDSDSDISQESIAEKKILKIDKKLSKHKAMDKVEKRRLQNRKSALKCRLRKTHTIQSSMQQISLMTKEVGQLKQERQSLYEEISQLKDKLRDEQLKVAKMMSQIPAQAHQQTPVYTYSQPMQYVQTQPNNSNNHHGLNNLMVQPLLQGGIQPSQYYPNVYVKYPSQQQNAVPMFNQYTM